MIKSNTRKLIKCYIEGFIKGVFDSKTKDEFDLKWVDLLNTTENNGNKPFHDLLLPDKLSISSKLVQPLLPEIIAFEECAKLIALDNHKYAERARRISGEISLKAIKRIEEMIYFIGRGKGNWSYPEFVKEIVRLAGEGETDKRTSIADLYIKKNDETEIFIEIKSPKPNKGQCLEATRRLLQIHGLTHSNHPGVEAYYATAYNPYGVDKETYKHSFALNYMDIDNQVLLGREFWDLVGGEGTYKEILDIYREVGREKGPDMLDQLALGY